MDWKDATLSFVIDWRVYLMIDDVENINSAGNFYLSIYQHLSIYRITIIYQLTVGLFLEPRQGRAQLTWAFNITEFYLNTVLKSMEP